MSKSTDDHFKSAEITNMIDAEASVIHTAKNNKLLYKMDEKELKDFKVQQNYKSYDRLTRHAKNHDISSMMSQPYHAQSTQDTVTLSNKRLKKLRL